MDWDSQALSDLGRIPISAAAPAGHAARYEPEFERVAGEIANLESVNPTPVAWDRVVQDGVIVLREKSKDLLIASYLCAGLFEREAYRGLASGLTVVHDLLEHFWGSLFPEPKRMRARAAAMTWLAERVGKRVSSEPPSASEHDVVEQCLNLVAKIQGLLEEHITEHPPSLGELRRPLEQYAKDLAPEPPPPTPDAAPAADVSPPQTSVSPDTQVASAAVAKAVPVSAPDEIGSDTDAQKALRSCQSALRSMASYYRGKKFADPRAFRLLRVGTWLGIEHSPPNQGGLTQLQGPSEERRNYLRGRVDAGELEAVCPEIEYTFSRAPYWLDAQRLIATALAGLGAPYESARHTVVASLRELLRRAPELTELKFMEGTPFADELTRLWIQEEVIGSETETAQSAVTPGAAAGEPWLTAFRDAKSRAAKGRIEDGVEYFREGRGRAASLRERFLWDLQQARFCHEAGYADVAIHQLEHLDELAERFSLEEWEPGLSLEVARLLLLCHDAARTKDTSGSPELTAKLERWRSRVSRLDVGAALALRKT